MKTYICLLWVVFGCIGWEMHASVDVHPTFITTSDGLANNSVRYLFQDSKGFIWMGTLDGLSRYDGHSFVTFRPESGDKISLANHHVKKIQEDRNGFLWFITAPELMQKSVPLFVRLTGKIVLPHRLSFLSTVLNAAE